MNITQLLYFINIVSYDFNISTAANKLHVSQSAVSKSINNFEKQENVTLFIRHGRRILGLTTKGKKFYCDAKRVIRDYEKLLSNVRNSNKITGKIKIGIASAVYESFFAQILIPFQSHHPNIKVQVSVLGSEKIQDQLVLGNLDLAYIVAPIKYDILHTEKLINSNAAIIYNPSFFDIPNNCTIDQLINYDMVLLDHSFTLRNQIDAIFSYSQKSPHVLYDSTSENFLVNSCRFNKVITILPESIIYGYNMNGLNAIPFKQINWELLSVTVNENSNPIVTNVQNEIDEMIQHIV